MTASARSDGPFEQHFWTDDAARDNRRARFHAAFSEEIVRIWSRSEQARGGLERETGLEPATFSLEG